MTVRLAMDAATDLASVAVSIDDTLAAEAALGARRAATSLVPAVDFVLDRSGVTLDDVDEIVLADGPGSFTGLRIGCATALGLTWDRSITVRTVPSLTGTACGALTRESQVAVALYDALRGEVFAAAYAFDNDRLVEHLAPTLTTISALRTRFTPDLVVGDGALAHPDEVCEWVGGRPCGGAVHEPRASCLLSPDVIRECSTVQTDFSSFEPDYGRLAEAQVRWESEHGRSLPGSAGSSF